MHKYPVGCSVAERQFPHPLFLKGWKFLFAHPTAVEIQSGRQVEISGTLSLPTRPQHADYANTRVAQMQGAA